MAPRPRDIDREQVFALAERCGSLAEVARNAGWKPGSLRSRLDSLGILEEVMDTIGVVQTPEPEGVTEGSDGSKTGVVAQGWTAEDVIRHFGDDPEECIVTTPLSATLWGNPEEPQERLKVSWVRKADTIHAPDISGWAKPPKPKVRPRGDDPRKVVICGDHHSPYVDWTLHTLFCQWLSEEKPDEGVILGDLLDLSASSRHRRGKKKTPAHVNEELRCAFKILNEYRHASPDTHWTLLPGNHDDRIDHRAIDNAPELFEVKPGGGLTPDGEEDERTALSMRRLLYLDELGIDYIFEDFSRAKHLLGQKITLRHGYLAGKNASDNMLKKITRSTVQGHTHRLRFIYKTEHDEHDEAEPTSTRVAVEAGCMAEIKDSLFYGDEEDWQQGFLVASLWNDGDFALSPNVYAPGRLLCGNGKRYVA